MNDTVEKGKTITVQIMGTDYGIKGDVDPDYIGKVARYVDGKMREVADNLSVPSSTRVAILAAINIADELFQEWERRKTLLMNVENNVNNLSESLNRIIDDGEEEDVETISRENVE